MKILKCSSELVHFDKTMLKIVNADGTLIKLDQLFTIKYVEKCPVSKKYWDIAANLKGCNRISESCFDLTTDDLEYHCLVDPHLNQTMEVCAPARPIIGGNYYTS